MKYSLLSQEEILFFRQRLALIAAGLGLLVLVLLGRLWYLQLYNGSYYEELSKGNRIRVIPQEAPRGIVYDRTGVILAFNRPSFNVQLIPEDAPDLNRTLANLSRVTGVEYPFLRYTARANRSSLKFKPITLLEDIGRKTADLIDSYQEDLPGIFVTVEPKRLYPTAYHSSHLLGYVGVINEGQLQALPLKKLTSGRVVGQAGVELTQNRILIGTDGGKQVEVDNVGRELRVLNQPVRPVPGNDIHLTIDLRLQRYIRTLMAGKNGAVVVMNPRTGEILSLNSYPDYDPNVFVGGIKSEKWAKLTQGEKTPLLNKATQGIYPPGSTFKMVLAAAGLKLGVIQENTTFLCPGYYRVGRTVAWCWNRAGHGEVNVKQALQQSCNVFFYNLGLQMGVDRISDHALMFGFGLPTGVEVESEKTGLLPNRLWKRKMLGERWYDGETLNLSIGQGFLSVTPMQLINYVNVIANRGLWVQPTLIRRAVTPDGQEIISDQELPRNSRRLPIAPQIFDFIRQGMILSVNRDGTGRLARTEKFVIAGKTGTSQVVGRKALRAGDDEIEERLLPHSLFVAFAPADDPQVSVVVLVEHGRSGGRVAAPIGRKILEFYAETIEPFSIALPQPSLVQEEKKTFRGALNSAFDPLPVLADAHGVADRPGN
ncbi:MAG: penicillin-binding protein 2 [SAR324 cluster bacterium]|nr:penicillin-binding protein 2 [SAR324 cluster bacterium]